MLTPPADHAGFREDMLQAACARLDRLPELFASFQQLFRDHDPVGLIASVAHYGLQRGMKEDGTKSANGSRLEQHHVELLQALMLTIPQAEWPAKLSTAKAVEQVFDELPTLSMAFLAQRIVAGREVDHDDVQARTVSALQERIRFHTHAVRNWGYFGDVVAIARDIYAPLDSLFLSHHGFAATDVIEFARAMTAEMERRLNVWDRALRPAVRAGSIPRMLERYYEGFPDLVGSPEKLADAIPADASTEQVIVMLMSHAELRLPDNATYDAATLAELTGADVERAEKVLRALALKPGALASQPLEFFFLANPIWGRPLIDLGDRFLAPMPQAIMSHIHAILRRLAEEANGLKQLDRARNAYLERKLTEALGRALPGATILSGATWSLGAQGFETDAIALIDKTLLIAEAKAHHLTPQGLRGAPDRVKRHVRELVVDPSLQSARLEAVVRQAQAGSVEARSALAEAGIAAPEHIERIIRLSVSLDDLSVLSSAEGELREAGWVPDDHQLAPMMNIADLGVVADILDRPILFLHYLAERGPFQRGFELVGDELDFLGLYLENGFSFGGVPKDARFVPSGMSERIDHHYDAKDAGISVPKPKARISSYFASILDRLNARRPAGWTVIGMNLLGAAGPDEQPYVSPLLAKARKAVRRKARGVEDGAIVQARPEVARKAIVTFYVHDHDDRATLRRSIENIVATTLEENEATECVVLARHIDLWHEPYQVACIAKKDMSKSADEASEADVRDGQLVET
ncbi:hypothetical protein CA238_04825 [Sphingomonas koreensis]|jgi:hypothetical protein|nr:hypothetical protein [Sphingomonas koreensis]RSU24698.1 hypothetical protein CA224_03080 [Sphingomonas koreensis]RSU52830.1 hypothetical protein CA221_04870 [Sphingomonas koreensis]RSU89974.1 hypothetical protein CA253_06825 [Sphingomonas koreensis]RSU96650.1 hypothetical protein DAH52_05320 [Sphingomonas koreensis]RSV27216.1 hypothetical protein CA238_04825 [Sphingomonas koreensis]